MAYTVSQFKVVSLREVPVHEALKIGDSATAISNYWDEVVTADSHFTQDNENFVIIFLNTRRKIIGHQVLSQGTLDTILVAPRDVFRAACIMNASAICLMHNHPSGDPTPSDADIKVTRDLIKCGNVMQIQVLDHVIKGDRRSDRPFSSLRDMGYFY